MSTLVFAGGLGPPGGGGITPEPKVFLTNPPADVTAVSANNISLNLVTEGVDGEDIEDAILLKKYGNVYYPAARLEINYKAESEDPSNVSIADFITDFEKATNRIVAHSDGMTGVSTIKKLFLLKSEGTNAIVICSGATSLEQTGSGCGSNEGVVEEIISLTGGYTGRYSISDYTYNNKNFWIISGITGTGAQSISLDFGGGDDLNFVNEDDLINLDEDLSRKYNSREGLSYYVLFNGEKYMFRVNAVSAGNDFASIYVESKGKTYILSPEESLDLDLDNDGSFDVTYLIEEINYPDVYSMISLYSSDGRLSFIPTMDEISRSERGVRGFSSREGIWSRFVKSSGISETQLFLAIGVIAVFLIAMVSFGRNLIMKVWRAT